MKSKRRHELQTNDLADRLGQFIEKARPYTTMILLLVVGAAVILAAGYYLTSSRTRKQGLAWRYFMAAGTDPQRDISDQLAEVADEYQGTAAGLWASQTAGDLELSRGVRLLFTDRALADTSLTQARSYFQEVAEHSDINSYPMLLRRARFGLAQTHETLGDLDKAKACYQLVIDEAEDDAIGAAASDRLKQLESPDAGEFYAWFGEQKPVPPAATSGGSSSPLGDLLDSPAAGLSDLPDGPGGFLSTDFGSSSDDAPPDEPVKRAGGSDEGSSEPPAEETESAAGKEDGQPAGASKDEPAGDPPADPSKS
jgi:hypothetical protein